MRDKLSAPDWAREAELFSAYIDDELDPSERAAFEERLEADDAFLAEYESFVRVIGEVRALPRPSAPPDFLEATMARIEREAVAPSWAARVPYEAIALAMLFVMAAIYMSVDSPRDVRLQDAPVIVAMHSVR